VWISLIKFSNMDLISGALLGPVRAADTRENNGAVVGRRRRRRRRK
jgi:hypothetical protein